MVSSVLSLHQHSLLCLCYPCCTHVLTCALCVYICLCHMRGLLVVCVVVVCSDSICRWGLWCGDLYCCIFSLCSYLHVVTVIFTYCWFWLCVLRPICTTAACATPLRSLSEWQRICSQDLCSDPCENHSSTYLSSWHVKTVLLLVHVWLEVSLCYAVA